MNVERKKLFEDRKYFEPDLSGFEDELSGLLDHKFKSYKNFIEKDSNYSFSLYRYLKDFLAIKSKSGLSEIVLTGYEVIAPNLSSVEVEKIRVNSGSLESKIRIQFKVKIEEKEWVSSVYLFNLPTLTQNASFILNGVERVILDKFSRSYGVFFRRSRTSNSFSAEIFPTTGRKLELVINRSKPVQVVYNKFFNFPLLPLLLKAGVFKSRLDFIQSIAEPVKVKNAEELKNRIENSHNLIFKVEGDSKVIVLGKMDTGENNLKLSDFKNIFLSPFENDAFVGTLLDESTINDKDYNNSLIQSVFFSTEEERNLFKNEIFDLGLIGRFILNKKLHTDSKLLKESYLVRQDILRILQEVFYLAGNRREEDDINNMEEKRVKEIGENLINHIYQNLLQFRKKISDRLELLEDKVRNKPEIGGVKKPSSNRTFDVKKSKHGGKKEKEGDMTEEEVYLYLLGSNQFQTSINNFFLQSPLSHFAIQINLLADITQKRRIFFIESSTNVDSKKIVSMQTRDIQPSFFGKICPIETPEGQNIGLIGSLTVYSRINDFGFIETPFFPVKAGKVQKSLVYLTVFEEKSKLIALSNRFSLDKNGMIQEKIVECRTNYTNSVNVNREEVDLAEISSDNFISISSALIPFLAHNDANRGTTGTNMYKQAVPLVRKEIPMVRTGMEERVVKQSFDVPIAPEDGVIKYSDANKIIFKTKAGQEIEFPLLNFKRTNQSTLRQNTPIYRIGDKVKKGAVLADNASSKNGILALGINALVAYVSMKGNFEDAIIISDSLVQRGALDSTHVEEFEVDFTKNLIGDEELTKNLPNASLESLEKLGPDGIVKIGSFVKAGDILVGKLTPIESTGNSGPEKLIRSVLIGSTRNKGHETKNTSLVLPYGESGIVTDVKVIRFEDSISNMLHSGLLFKIKVSVTTTRRPKVGDKLCGRHGNKGIIALIMKQQDMPFMKDGTPIEVVFNPLGVPSRLNPGQISESTAGLGLKKLDLECISKAFNNVSEESIFNLLEMANESRDSTVPLIDGRTGEYLDSLVMVGYQYIFKLNHLVDKKIYCRSVGKYSLISQQPISGRTSTGGQRDGEMELWALAGYGAKGITLETITLRSDDIAGRNKTYASIINGNPLPQAGVPESTKILVKIMQSLCIKVDIYDKHGNLIKL